MTQPIDTAYVELEARGEEDAVRDIERAVKEITVAVDTASKNIQVEMKDAVDEIGSSVTESVKSAEKAVDEIAETTKKNLDEIDRKAKETGDSLGESFDSSSRASRSLFTQLAELGGQLRNISALAPPPVLLALVAAVPAIIALGGALVDLSALALLLPAGLGVLASSVAALQFAFDGFGSAVGSLATGDLEKINKVMKELAPSARAVAREVFALRKPLDDLKLAVQESFFAPLRGDIENLGRVAIPVLRSGLSQIGGAFGEFGSQLADLLGEVDILNDLRDIFEGTARIIDSFAPRAVDLLGTLFGVAEHGMPFLERAFDALGRGMENLTQFLGDALASGDFDRFLEDAFQIMSDLGELTQSVFGLIGALFGDMGDEGSNFIQTLTQMIDKMTEFLNSADGQETLQRTVDVLKVFGVAILAVVDAIIFMIQYMNFWYKAFGEIGAAIVVAAKAVGDFFQELWGWISGVGSAIGDFFGTVGKFFSSIGGWFAGIGSAIGEAFTTLVTFITTFFQWITNLENLSYTIGFIIGSVIRTFFMLRDTINTVFINIGKFIIGTWATIQKFTYDTVLAIVNSVINFFVTLPERIANIFNAVRDFIVSAFRKSRDTAVNQAGSMRDGVVNFFRSLRDRAIGFIRDLPENVVRIFNSIATRALSIGRNIIQGIVNGIKNGYSAALDTAKRVARGILEGMKDALGIGSPSKLAAVQIGRPIMQGVGVGAEDEARNLRSMLNGTVGSALPGGASITNNTGSAIGGGNVTFDAGAVQVVFQGAVPTEQEAFRTGQAVGAGIAQTMARRNVRTAVRMA